MTFSLNYTTGYKFYTGNKLFLMLSWTKEVLSLPCIHCHKRYWNKWSICLLLFQKTSIVCWENNNLYLESYCITFSLDKWPIKPIHLFIRHLNEYVRALLYMPGFLCDIYIPLANSVIFMYAFVSWGKCFFSD